MRSCGGGRRGTSAAPPQGACATMNTTKRRGVGGNAGAVRPNETTPNRVRARSAATRLSRRWGWLPSLVLASHRPTCCRASSAAAARRTFAAAEAIAAAAVAAVEESEKPSAGAEPSAVPPAARARDPGRRRDPGPTTTLARPIDTAAEAAGAGTAARDATCETCQTNAVAPRRLRRRPLRFARSAARASGGGATLSMRPLLLVVKRPDLYAPRHLDTPPRSGRGSMWSFLLSC